MWPFINLRCDVIMTSNLFSAKILPRLMPSAQSYDQALHWTHVQGDSGVTLAGTVKGKPLSTYQGNGAESTPLWIVRQQAYG